MEKNIKLLLGKILGEIYEMQGFNCVVSPGTVYGLQNGFEFILDEVIGDYKITTEDYKNFVSILNPIYNNKENLSKFNGYYDIEEEMNKVGIDREKAILLFNYFNRNNCYEELIKKLNSPNSPNELKTFR
ncbi:hypothetical protein NON08_14800 [Cetobacterium somerae]|uniref:hypothetical protein n=1 Tax=Cetobacterium sp. NK01 TaxID=2993530 RepID=UPI002116B1BF|nr:hypothetical protein [Cetobacterium sp. NK01]MCQ8213768.1 hypothetical protein [Cetobacterium sp. NK01]